MRHVAGNREVWLGIVSSSRAENVLPMESLLDRPATWYVRPEDDEAYTEAGASTQVVAYPEGYVSWARNALLQDAWAEGLPAVMLDDDLKGMRVVKGKKAEPVHPWDGITELTDRLFASDLYLAGASPTDNPYFAHKESSTNLFIIASLCVVRPCDLWFDPEYAVKEDYDYTLQHIGRFGGAYRWNMLMPNFQHYTNPGGFTEIRTDEMEEQACQRLLAAWPGQIRRNKKREHEVLLSVKRTRSSV